MPCSDTKFNYGKYTKLFITICAIVCLYNLQFHFFSGIMTLTRTPCELDKMSLFQDLKLKRRKVDSRCSSDGKHNFIFFKVYFV